MELTSSNNDKRHSRLSSFVGQYQTKKAYKHQLKVELKARTQRQTHEAEMEIQGQCDQRMQHCKATFNMQRTPISGESQNWALQAKIQTVAPEQVRNGEEPEEKQSRALVQAGKS